jgi:radical SAM protein with 4Fe4S-binding SPASM domain
MLSIRADGELGPCGQWGPEHTVKLGEQSLKEAWYGEFFSRLRADFKEGKLLRQCRDCCAYMVLDELKLLENLPSLPSLSSSC